MGDYIVIGIVLVFVVLMSILPKPVYNAITRAFSMHKNGIRRIQRYHTTTDSIGNLMLGISVFFCIFYCYTDSSPHIRHPFSENSKNLWLQVPVSLRNKLCFQGIPNILCHFEQYAK